MPQKKAITDKQMKWLLRTGRKRYTITQLAKRFQIGFATVHNYLKLNGLKAATRRQQLTAAVIKAAINGNFNDINSFAKKLNACQKQIAAISREYNVFPTAPHSINGMRSYKHIPMTQERATQLIEMARARGCLMLKLPKQKTKQPSKKEKLEYVKQLLQSTHYDK